jgi:hypothetical protein
MPPFPENTVAYAEFADDVDAIVATLAIGLGLERDRGLQAGMVQLGAPKGRAGLLLELTPTWGVIAITADGGVVAQRGQGGAVITLDSLYARHDQLGAALRRAQASAMSAAVAVVRPFFTPDRFPTQREFLALQRWAPLIEKPAYKIAARCVTLLEDTRRYALGARGKTRPARPLNSYFGVLHAMGHLTLLASAREAQDWLSDMAHTFTWVNWTPSFALVRERTAWLAAAAARSAAAFGPAVAPNYFKALEDARHPTKVFDTLLGLVAIACAHDEALGPVEEGIVRRQRDSKPGEMPGQHFADLAYQSALASLKAWRRGQPAGADPGGDAEADPDLATRQALWIDPTDPGPDGHMFGIAMLPTVLSVSAEHHYPVRSFKVPQQRLMREILYRAWSPAPDGTPTLH